MTGSRGRCKTRGKRPLSASSSTQPTSNASRASIQSNAHSSSLLLSLLSHQLQSNNHNNSIVPVNSVDSANMESSSNQRQRSSRGSMESEHGKTKRSAAWSHFEERIDSNGLRISKCKYCATIYKVGGTGNMLNHIRDKHQDKITIDGPRLAVVSSPSNLEPKKPAILLSFFFCLN